MSATAPTSLFELDPQAVRCPHLALAALAEDGPVRWVPEIEAYAVTRYDDIVEVNRHPERFSSRHATGVVLARQIAETSAQLAADEPEIRDLIRGPAARGRAAVLLAADPPVHGRQRKLVSRAFSARAVKAREPAIRQIAEQLLDGFAGGGEIELVRAFAVPLPLAVIADALGVPRARMEDFKRWSDDFVVAIGNHNLTGIDLARMLRSQAEFFEYFAAEIAARRAEPRDDLVSELSQARIDGEELTEPELLSMFSQFLVAGNETTTKLICSAALRLAQDPELADQLRTHPAGIADLVEEALRLDAPVQGLFRTANEDVELGGVPIPAGASLWLAYAAGNRDPEHFARPDECVLGRRDGVAHLAFGLGEHYCLGASLARAEAQIALERLLSRFSQIDLVGRPDELTYEPSYVLHGLARLPLQLTPTA